MSEDELKDVIERTIKNRVELTFQVFRKLHLKEKEHYLNIIYLP